MNLKQGSVRSAYEYIKKELAGIYSEREILSLCYIILEHKLELKRHEIMLYPEALVTDATFNQISEMIHQLKEEIPIQHILGSVEFCGLSIRVTPDVLIPRPETEELVSWITENENDQELVVLDIGTGSACIALALKMHFHHSVIYASDISAEALSVAKDNAGHHQLSIHFLEHDVLKEDFSLEKSSVDLIVSNPPYIKVSEKSFMEKRVLLREPSQALFVPDEDPLLFYHAISIHAAKLLKPEGRLFFEIHEHHAKEIQQLLHHKGFRGIQLRKDIHEKDRMISAIKTAI